MIVLKPTFEIITPMPWDEMVKHVERAGRVCYKSEYRIKQGSATQFIRYMIDRGHESVIEHIGFSVLFTVDRGITHELVRHRLASYSQESTRYCNYANARFGSEIAVIGLGKAMDLDFSMDAITPEEATLILQEWFQAMQDAEQHYMKMIDLGASAQIARSVLPQSVKADIMVTANIREWRHILRLRTSRAAHPQMREVMIPLLLKLKTECPVFFGDIKPDPESVRRLGLDDPNH
jgi:thymidylate synthase (FAD)